MAVIKTLDQPFQLKTESWRSKKTRINTGTSNLVTLSDKTHPISRNDQQNTWNVEVHRMERDVENNATPGRAERRLNSCRNGISFEFEHSIIFPKLRFQSAWNDLTSIQRYQVSPQVDGSVYKNRQKKNRKTFWKMRYLIREVVKIGENLF